MKKLNLRLPDHLHARVKEDAEQAGMSMNDFLLQVLLEHIGHLGTGAGVGEPAVTGSAESLGEGAAVALSDPAPRPVRPQPDGGALVSDPRGSPDLPCDHEPYRSSERPYCYRCGERI